MSNIVISPQSGVIEFNNGTAGSSSFSTSTAPIRLDATGGNVWFTGSNVGIGTTNPSQKLEVNGAIKSSQYLYLGSDVSLYRDGSNILRTDDALHANGGISVGGVAGGGFIYNRSETDSYIKFDDPNIVMMGGNVGIGSTSPQTILDVDGASNHGIRIGTNNALIGEGGSTGTQLIFWNGNSAYYGRSAAPFNHSVSNHFFRVGGNDIAMIGSAGVGIGTLSPQAQLQVNTPNHNTFALAIGNDSYVGGSPRHELLMLNDGSLSWYLPDNGSTPAKFQFYSRDTATYPFTVVSDTARIGIGTTNPTHTLDVESADETVASFNSTDNKCAIALNDDDTTVYVSAENSRGALGFQAGLHADNLNIDTAGNVGIGTHTTTTPGGTAKLTSLASSVAFSWGTSSTEYVYHRRLSAGKFQIVPYYGGNVGELHLAPYGENDTPVVIGATDAVADVKLHVEGVVSGSNSFLGTGVGNRITNNGVPYLLSGDSPAETQTLQDVCDNGNTTTTAVNITGAITVANNIFKNVENSFLGLYGGSDTLTNDGFIKIHGNSDNWGKVQTNIGYDATNSKAHWTLNNTTELMTLKGNGRLGIGTTDPNQLLHVDGKTQLGTNGFTEGGLLINYASLSETKGGASTLLGNAVYAGTTNNTFRRTKGDAGNYIALNYNKGITFHTNVTGNTSDDYDINNHEQMRLTTGGFLGIGTTDPQAKLDVNGTFRSVGIAYLNSDVQVGGDQIIFTNDSASAYIQGADSLYIESDYDNDDSENKPIIFRTSAVERVRIAGNGSVGIGTDTAPQKLTVKGTIVHTNSSNIQVAGMTNSSDAGRLYANNAGGVTNVLLDSNGDSYLKGGDVGIGTATPDAKLHVEGSMQVKGDASWAGTDSQNGAIFMDTAGRGLLGAFSTHYARPLITANSNYIEIGSAGTSLIYGSKIYAGSASSTVGTHNFYTSGTNLRMHIAKDGNVGIGLSDPDTLLEVAGVIKSSSTSRVQADTYNNSANSANIIYRSSSKTIVGNNADAVVILDGGNVGIGTSSPSYCLEVTESKSSSLLSRFYNSSSTNGQGLLIRAGETSNENRILQLASRDDTKVMTVNSNGKVGIGTTAPDQKLEVVGQAIIDGGVGVSSSATLHLRQKGDTANDGLAITSSHATSHRIWKNGAGTLNIGPSTDTDAFVQDLDGNVGIGTNSPASLLHVSSASSESELRIESDNGNGDPFIHFKLDAGSSYSVGIDDDDSNAFKISRNATLGTNDILKVDSTTAIVYNNLLVGEADGTLDGSRLEVWTTNSQSPFSITNTNNSNRKVLDSAFNSNHPRFSIFNASATETIRLETNGDSFFNGGNVGIGTSSPDMLLTVEGKLRSVSNMTLGSDETYGGTYGAIGIGTTSLTNGQHRIFAKSSDHMYFAAATSKGFRFRPNGGATSASAGVTIASDGDVGIGTTAPSSKLEVQGTIQTQVYAIGSLPSASPAGQRAMVNDASSSFDYYSVGQTVGAGGSYVAPVYSDGSNWRYG